MCLVAVRGEPGHTRDIQTADAQPILNAASARMLRVSFGVM